MAKPTKPKTLKPKAAEDVAGGPPSSGGGGGFDLKTIVLVVAIILSSIVGPAATMYFLGPMVIVPAIVSQIPKGGEAAKGEHAAEGEEGGEGEEGAHKNAVGMNLELDEFTVNLKADPKAGANQYLRAKMSLSVEVPPAEDCHAHHAEGEKKAEGGGGGHGGGEGAAANPGEACQKGFNEKMGRYVPTIRDIINTSLMRQTASTLSSTEGQEALKDQIIQEVNPLMESDGYKILRVNFQDFVLQR
jgi:flagellar basal body-associated protein FliL